MDVIFAKILYAVNHHYPNLEDAMQEIIFRDFLSSRGYSPEEIDRQVNLVHTLETNLQKSVPPWTLEDLNSSSTQAVVDEMIDNGENTSDNLIVMLRYAKAIGNRDMFKTLFEMLDGYEAMDNLSKKLAEHVGDELRDIVFEGIPLPPLGLAKRDKARYSYRVMRRMGEIFEEQVCREILSDSLRDLPDEYYAESKTDFHEICKGNIDQYLKLKGQKFIDTLRDHKQRGELFFGQEITDDVIDFVKSNPEMGGGVRSGDVIYETKIPFNTKAYLEEMDPEKKRYHYCHCPWVKESIRHDTLKVSATFCQCSAGFHKKPYEMIYESKLKAEVLMSVLRGDPICRFAIHIPKQQT
jgi:hypothetical protein